MNKTKEEIIKEITELLTNEVENMFIINADFTIDRDGTTSSIEKILDLLKKYKDASNQDQAISEKELPRQ